MKNDSYAARLERGFTRPADFLRLCNSPSFDVQPEADHFDSTGKSICGESEFVADAQQGGAAMSPISQGLPPLPLSTSSYFEPMFTVDQMREYGDARAAHARRVAMDEAAKFIENGSFLHDQAPGKLFANQVAPLIRSMK